MPGAVGRYVKGMRDNLEAIPTTTCVTIKSAGQQSVPPQTAVPPESTSQWQEGIVHS